MRDHRPSDHRKNIDSVKHLLQLANEITELVVENGLNFVEWEFVLGEVQANLREKKIKD